MHGCHEPYLHMFTHNLALSGSSPPLSPYPLPLLRLRLCSTVRIGLSLWPRELDKPPWSWRGRRLLHSSETLLVERVERLNSFKNRWEGLQRHLPLAILLCNPSARPKGTPGKAVHLGKIIILVCFYHSIVERSLTAAISDVSNARVLSKLTNKRVH